MPFNPEKFEIGARKPKEEEPKEEEAKEEELKEKLKKEEQAKREKELKKGRRVLEEILRTGDDSVREIVRLLCKEEKITSRGELGLLSMKPENERIIFRSKRADAKRYEGNINEMREWGRTGEEIGRAFKRWPKLLTYDLKKKSEDFDGELGISQEDFGKSTVRFPSLPGFDPKRIREESERELGISGKALGKSIVRTPQLASCDIENNVKPKLELLRRIGVGEEEEMEEFLKIAILNARVCELIVETAQELGIKIGSGREIRAIYKRLDRNISKTKRLSVAEFVKKAQLEKREQAMEEEIKKKLGKIFGYYLKDKARKSFKPGVL